MRDGTSDETSGASRRSALLFSTREARSVRGENFAVLKQRSINFSFNNNSVELEGKQKAQPTSMKILKNILHIYLHVLIAHPFVSEPVKIGEC